MPIWEAYSINVVWALRSQHDLSAKIQHRYNLFIANNLLGAPPNRILTLKHNPTPAILQILPRPPTYLHRPTNNLPPNDPNLFRALDKIHPI
jgi:hypothetical protein